MLSTNTGLVEGQQPFSLSCIHATNSLADWHLIVSKAQDKESRWKIMNSAAMVQSSTGDHNDDEKSKKLWLEERFLA